MKVLAAKLALVITLGAVGSGVAVPATQAGASTCTPSVFHVHLTRYVNPKYVGLVTSQHWLSPDENTNYNYQYKGTLAFSVTDTTTVSLGVTTGVSVAVTVSDIVASAQVATKLDLTASIAKGHSTTLTQTLGPRRWGYTRLFAPVYKFSGTLQTIDVACGVIDHSYPNHIVTIPGKVGHAAYDFAI